MQNGAYRENPYETEARLHRRPARHHFLECIMNADITKLTDSLERQLNAREVEAQRGAAFAGGSTGLFDRVLHVADLLGRTIRFLRSQARRAKVDYVAG